MFGRALKVRYKVPSRFKSLEQNQQAGVRWKNGQFWGQIKLEPIIEQSNRYSAWVELICKVCPHSVARSKR